MLHVLHFVVDLLEIDVAKHWILSLIAIYILFFLLNEIKYKKFPNSSLKYICNIKQDEQQV